MLLDPTHGQPLRARLRMPGDKSISHRALVFAAMAHGTSDIYNLLQAEDVVCTQRCLTALGVRIEQASATHTVVHGRGPRGLRSPLARLDCGNSGTSMRLLLGAIAASGCAAQLTGDASLLRRPMARVVAPLQQMGAEMQTAAQGLPPVQTHSNSKHLQAGQIQLSVASAQVQTAVLLANLSAQGVLELRGSGGCRDHSTRMLQAMGLEIQTDADGTLRCAGGQTPQAIAVNVPGDPSSAAFWLAAAAIVPGSEVCIEQVSLNETRLGFVRVLQAMGAQVDIEPQVLPAGVAEPSEPIGCITVRHRPLQAVVLEAADVPAVIDELPLFAVVAQFARGQSRVHGAQELRVKESDRIDNICANLQAMGGAIVAQADGFVVDGQRPLHGAVIRPRGDHRVAMAMAIATLGAGQQSQLQQAECVAVSYPQFLAEWQRLCGGARAR